jgi:hypothetical protein
MPSRAQTLAEPNLPGDWSQSGAFVTLVMAIMSENLSTQCGWKWSPSGIMPPRCETHGSACRQVAMLTRTTFRIPPVAWR